MQVGTRLTTVPVRSRPTACAMRVTCGSASRNRGDSLRLPGAATNGAITLQLRSQKATTLSPLTDVLVVILLPLIDLLVVNVSLARSRLIISSFCHRSVRCRPPRRRGYGGRRRPDDSAAHRAYRASLGHCRY